MSLSYTCYSQKLCLFSIVSMGLCARGGPDWEGSLETCRSGDRGVRDANISLSDQLTAYISEMTMELECMPVPYRIYSPSSVLWE